MGVVAYGAAYVVAYGVALGVAYGVGRPVFLRARIYACLIAGSFTNVHMRRDLYVRACVGGACARKRCRGLRVR
jgi:hypothetical protein